MLPKKKGILFEANGQSFKWVGVFMVSISVIAKLFSTYIKIANVVALCVQVTNCSKLGQSSQIVYTKMFEWGWLKQGMDTWSKTCVIWDEQLMKSNQIMLDFTCATLLLIHSDLHTDSIKTT